MKSVSAAPLLCVVVLLASHALADDAWYPSRGCDTF
jgi:hypothetical protein